MKWARWILMLLVACVAVCAERPATAQYPRDALPPTFSPWLNLYRRDSGPLGPYLGDVRPEQRLRRTIRNQEAAIQRQGASISAIGQQVNQWGRTGTIRATGTGSGFMNYANRYQNLSHYYGESGVPTPRRRPAAPPSSGRSGAPHRSPVSARGYSGL